MNDLKKRGFASISTPDGKYCIWLRRSKTAGEIHVTCSFTLQGHPQLVDSIDHLGFVNIDSVRNVDPYLSYITVKCNPDEEHCIERLIEALPGLMEQHLVNPTQQKGGSTCTAIE